MDEMQFWQIRQAIERLNGEFHLLSRQVHDLIEMNRHPMYHYQYGPQDAHPGFGPVEHFSFSDMPGPTNEELDQLLKIPTPKDEGWESA